MRRSLRSTYDHMWRSSDELSSLGIGADSDILDFADAACVDLLQPPQEETYM